MARSAGTDPFGPPRFQVCGRCRRPFAGDPTLAQDLDNGWWACPPCRDVLLGARALAMPPVPAGGVR